MADALQLHSDQVEYWNGAGGARWVANQTRRDKLLADFAEAVLERAAAQSGESVIDIGCGCGETTVELAKAVGPSGKVIGADVSAPILAVAAERLGDYPQAEAILADASSHPFEPASADLLFSRFGVMFFGDPVEAFKNLRKALKPNGRLVFACWRKPTENLWMTAPLEAVWKHVEKPPQPDPHAPGPFAFADNERLSRILVEAGFTAPKFEMFDPLVDVASGRGVEGAVGTALEFGPTARVLADQPDEVKDKVEASLHDFFAPLLKDGAIKMPAAIWLVTSTAA